jgi:DNA-binding PadR family transcriptional regulator
MPLKAALCLIMNELEYSGCLAIRWLPICESVKYTTVAYAEKHGLITSNGKTIAITNKGLQYVQNQ